MDGVLYVGCLLQPKSLLDRSISSALVDDRTIAARRGAPR